MNTIEDLIHQIKKLEKKLSQEIQEKEAEFFYKIKNGKVRFEKEVKHYHKTLMISLPAYIIKARLVNVLTVPFIWCCFIPAVFMDIVVTAFQIICFPIYKIPKVSRSKYIKIDRHSLHYLNIIEKINCVYCGYFNGLIAYVQEVAARTEQYWCPIKHSGKIGMIHSRYKHFLDYGDGDNYQKNLDKIRSDFSDLD